MSATRGFLSNVICIFSQPSHSEHSAHREMEVRCAVFQGRGVAYRHPHCIHGTITSASAMMPSQDAESRMPGEEHGLSPTCRKQRSLLIHSANDAWPCTTRFATAEKGPAPVFCYPRLESEMQGQERGVNGFNHKLLNRRPVLKARACANSRPSHGMASIVKMNSFLSGSVRDSHSNLLISLSPFGRVKTPTSGGSFSRK
jgi:hypothetical protein